MILAPIIKAKTEGSENLSDELEIDFKEANRTIRNPKARTAWKSARNEGNGFNEYHSAAQINRATGYNQRVVLMMMMILHSAPPNVE